MVCPLAKMYTVGSSFIPNPDHAGGLRFHGMSTVLSQLYHDGYMEARAVSQTDVFAAAEQFARVEGILPAPESSHAIRVAIDEALKCKETGEEKTIVFGLTGTGYFDLVAYEKFNNGEMSDYIPSDEELEMGFAKLPKVEEGGGARQPLIRPPVCVPPHLGLPTTKLPRGRAVFSWWFFGMWEGILVTSSVSMVGVSTSSANPPASETVSSTAAS